jgi:hypothetical protein
MLHQDLTQEHQHHLRITSYKRYKAKAIRGCVEKRNMGVHSYDRVRDAVEDRVESSEDRLHDCDWVPEIAVRPGPEATGGYRGC